MRLYGQEAIRGDNGDDNLLAAEDIAGWAERLDTIVIADLVADQKPALLSELEKLRSVAYQKMQLIKG